MARDWNEWFDALYQKEYDRLYGVAYRMTGNTETAHELTQDAFLWAWLHREKLLNHPKPGGWLMKTLTNLVKNENRRFSSRELSLEDQFQLPAPEVDRGIGEVLPIQLPEEDRRILVWRFEEGLDYREIANRLGISETGCRSRVFRAVEKCRKLLQEKVAHR